MAGERVANYTFAQLKDLWIQAGGSPTYADMAAAIAMAESGGRSDAYNGSNSNGSADKGLWQINTIHGKQSTFDPVENAKAAVAISKGGTDWRPWCVAWSNGGCGGTFMGDGSPVLKYLPSGSNATGVIPTNGNSNPFAAGADLSTAASVFKTILSAIGFSAPEEILRKVAKIGWQYATWIAFIVGGLMVMTFGMVLIFLSTRVAKTIGNAAIGIGSTRLAFGGKGGDMNIHLPENPVYVEDNRPVTAILPSQQPAIGQAQPIFPPLDADRRARLGRSEDNMRNSLKPSPRVRPSRRKASVEYEARHRSNE